jgi:AcrR family transcriptional regulator
MSEHDQEQNRRGREDPRVTQTRELVYAATLEVIAEVGAAGVSVERIAARSGVARSTIYRRWPDQSKLFLEAFAQLARRGKAVQVTGDTARDLETYLTEYAARLNDPTYVAVLIALLDRAARDHDFARLHRRMLDERRSRVVAIFRAGIRAGTIKKGTDVHEALVALVSPFAYMSLVRHERIRPRDVQRVLRDVLDRYGTNGAPPDGRPKTRRSRSDAAVASTAA